MPGLEVRGMKKIYFVLNGKPVEANVEDNETVIEMLRERFGLKSVKEGCSIGECGVCTVLVDDEPRYGCLTLSFKVDGRDVKTVEFLGDGENIHPLQQSFMESGAVQCGYCTPAMLLTAYSLLLKKGRGLTRDDIRGALSGNLCRCTGYIQIIEAVENAAGILDRNR